MIAILMKKENEKKKTNCAKIAVNFFSETFPFTQTIYNYIHFYCSIPFFCWFAIGALERKYNCIQQKKKTKAI